MSLATSDGVKEVVNVACRPLVIGGVECWDRYTYVFEELHALSVIRLTMP